MRPCNGSNGAMVLVLTFGMAWRAEAQRENHHHLQHAPAGGASAGEIKAFDKEARKIIIEQRQSTNKGVVATTLQLRVDDSTLLVRVKQGDKVNFVVKNVRAELTVSALESVR